MWSTEDPRYELEGVTRIIVYDDVRRWVGFADVASACGAYSIITIDHPRGEDAVFGDKDSWPGWKWTRLP
jgi:hypothetical protein